MDGQLPEETSATSAKNSTSLLLAISTIVFVGISAYLFLQNQQLKSDNTKQETSSKTSPTTIEAKPKSALFPFDPKKAYVTSTVIYQQVSGKVIAYDTNTYTVTLEKFGEQFKVKLPLGPSAQYTPPGFADVSGMRNFKIGDEVVIGGQSSPTGEFEITRFVISGSSTP